MNREETIRAALAEVAEPNLGGDLVSSGVVRGVSAQGDAPAKVRLEFPYPAKSVFRPLAGRIRDRLSAAGAPAAELDMEVVIHARMAQGGAQKVPEVKNIVAVASAKGGVGKSTTAANLALALAAEGARAGILDADIYGPSLPTMLGLNRRPQGDENNKIVPLESHGLQAMSIGFLMDEEQPAVLRAPMAVRYLTAFLRDTLWQDLDYLILDMPPGTGDIQLSVAQQVPVTGAVVVTTPQALAAADAQRGIVMFNKVSVPVLGLVENMALFRCPGCGAAHRIFGEGGARRLCEKHDSELLGELPLDPAIRDSIDSGRPTVVSDPDGEASQIYRKIAVRVGVKIAQRSRDRSAAFPQIVVSDQ